MEESLRYGLDSDLRCGMVLVWFGALKRIWISWRDVRVWDRCEVRRSRRHSLRLCTRRRTGRFYPLTFLYSMTCHRGENLTKVLPSTVIVHRQWCVHDLGSLLTIGRRWRLVQDFSRRWKTRKLLIISSNFHGCSGVRWFWDGTVEFCDRLRACSY